MPRADAKRPPIASVRRRGFVWLAALLLLPSYAAAADDEDVDGLRRMLRELREQNRELSRRLDALERRGGSAARLHPRGSRRLRRLHLSPQQLSR